MTKRRTNVMALDQMKLESISRTARRRKKEREEAELDRKEREELLYHENAADTLRLRIRQRERARKAADGVYVGASGQ